MEEVWKDIAGYEGLYQISSLGNVRSLNYRRHGHAKLLTPKCNNRGRLWVELSVDGARKPWLIHRLVGLAFIPNPNDYPQINHKDENPKNNRVENLEWCTHEYNLRYSLERNATRGSRHRGGKKKAFPIKQLTISGELVRQWDNSRQVATETGWSDWSVSECCRGRRKTAYGYIWRYANYHGRETE